VVGIKVSHLHVSLSRLKPLVFLAGQAEMSEQINAAKARQVFDIIKSLNSVSVSQT